MLYWSEYRGHDTEIIRNKIDNTIYTFDIETTSYLILNGEIIPASNYLKLSEEDRQKAIPQACMYIWQFSVNDQVYYGRTWDEFQKFIDLLEANDDHKKIIYVHNLSFEFQFICKVLKIRDVLSRKSRKVMSARLADYNIEFRCTYYLSNVKLEKLSDIYGLSVKKKTGDLNYDLIRTPATKLTDKELGYCEYDCLVTYQYIRFERDQYGSVNKIPLTSTGKVRRELQHLVMKDPYYRRIVNECINIRPSVYNMLIEAFAGGYTHANFIYSDEVLPNVDSYDETSAYPYVLVSHKFPMSEFKKCEIKKAEDMLQSFAYLVRVKFHNIKCKYYNNFISASKCLDCAGARIDNGRIIRAKEVYITLTDVDFRFILDTYEVESYEIVDSYYALYKYLPVKFIDFVLDKYVNKTKFKNVEGKELEYALEKAKFNSIYGMTVTNMIRDDVNYNSNTGWSESPLSDTAIFDKLLDEKKKSFLSFAWGVWVTAYARDNLLRRVIALDQYTAYCDTDSVKLVEGYDKSVFEEYNKSVFKKIKRASADLGIPLEKYSPKDSKGREHLLGVFEFETINNREHTYDKFITQGAKKYCIERDGQIEITVSGVPKKGGEKCLSKVDDFRDDLVFDYENTNKKTLIYNDIQIPLDIVDYNGIKYKVEDKSGICLLPTTYKLGKALEYANLLTDNSSARAKFRKEI